AGLCSCSNHLPSTPRCRSSCRQLAVIEHPEHRNQLTQSTTYDRRAFMAYFSSIGLGSTLFPGVLWAQAQQQPQGPAITNETIAAAEQIADVSFTDQERTALVRGLQQARNAIDQLHQLPLDMSVLPAIVFDP